MAPLHAYELISLPSARDCATAEQAIKSPVLFPVHDVQIQSHWASSGSYTLRLEAGGVHRFSSEVVIPAIDERRNRMAQEIRLACMYCDTSECDGISTIPTDWTDVQSVQSYAAACEEIAADDPKRSPFEWYTHLGVCPACQKIYG